MSTGLIIIGCIILIAVVVVQIGRVTDLAAKIRGEEEVQWESNHTNGILSVVFMVGFLVFCVWSAGYYKNWMMGYGPHESASAHGGELDAMFDVTLIFTGIVFIITQIALFWFAYKYRGQKGKIATFIPHDNKLEIIWTAIPAVVMCFLVIRGLVAWNEVMADIPVEKVSKLIPENDNEYLEIGAVGSQFLWYLRYPGADGKLGTRDYTMITGANPLGQDWTDEKNLDDFQPTEIVLPVNRQVRVRITSRDVLHNFAIPQMRIKMDAVPGMPTYFVFTPTITTEEYRQRLRPYEEYQALVDPSDPDSPQLWENYHYELACMELCGKGHFSMRKIVRIVTEEEYKEWLSEQRSYYMVTIRNTDEDPHKGKLHDVEIRQRKQEFNDAVEKALSATDAAEKIIRFNYVTFETNLSELTPLSKYELDNLVTALNKYPNMTIEVAGHTDSDGEDQANLTLSNARATTVYNYLIAKGIAAERLTAAGYGETRPIDTNDTEAGKAKNRRTEFQVLTQ